MPRGLRSSLVLAAFVVFLCGRGAFAQTLDWAVTPVGPNGVTIGQFSQNWPHPSALDADGNLFIAGHTFGNSTSTLPDGYGEFLGKFRAADGAMLWRYSSPGTSWLGNVALDASGDAF